MKLDDMNVKIKMDGCNGNEVNATIAGIEVPSDEKQEYISSPMTMTRGTSSQMGGVKFSTGLPKLDDGWYDVELEVTFVGYDYNNIVSTVLLPLKHGANKLSSFVCGNVHEGSYYITKAGLVFGSASFKVEGSSTMLTIYTETLGSTTDAKNGAASLSVSDTMQVNKVTSIKLVSVKKH